VRENLSHGEIPTNYLHFSYSQNFILPTLNLFD
jgi:hypothetical protein